MATGDRVLTILQVMPPATSMAGSGVRAGGSSPAERVTFWSFDGSSAEYMDFLCALKGYGGGGLTIRLGWMAASATSGSVRWGAAIRRLQDDTEDVDTSQTYDFNEATAPAATASGEVVYDNITFTNGADMDSWADNEMAILRIRRNPADAADDMTGDAQLIGVVGYET